MSAGDYRAHLRQRLVACGVPGTLHAGLIEYVAARRPTGGFLRACLENDLLQACVRADAYSSLELIAIVRWLHAFVTSEAWGSPEKVAAWLADPHAVPEVFE